MAELTVGDELIFKPRYGQLQIWPITHITPSGRLICNGLTLNPDLSIRGPEKEDYARVQIATDADRQRVQDYNEKRELIRAIRSVDMQLLANSQLQRILEIIHE